MRSAVPLLVLLALLLAGCLSSEPAAPAPGPTQAGDCVHPWPCGDEWPADLEGPFALREIRHVQVESHDGTPLDGWILLPDVPADVQVPTVLWSAPYFGQLYPTPDHPAPVRLGGVDAELLVEHGYAVAQFNVRGTGNSGGCLDLHGPDEQRDQEVLVEWLADQPWSNGRVGMMGGSYDGTTPWEAAIRNPPALKTIVPMASSTNGYLFFHTPQGAVFPDSGPWLAQYAGYTSFLPPLAMAPGDATVDHASVVAEALCPEVAEVIADLTLAPAGGERSEAFWAPRNLLKHFPDVTASVLIAHGFQDLQGSGHQQQELAAWHALEKAPKRMIEGQWGHSAPKVADWNARLLAWFDFWLKGVGDAPGVGLVEYEDDAGTWHASSAWPPAEAHNEVLHLADGSLAAEPGDGSAAFVSTPHPGGPEGILCAGLAPTGATWMSEPVREPVRLAGNPFVHLEITSDAPGGLVSLHLYDVGDDPCDARFLTYGAADLRYHAGGYEARDFPVGSSTGVRIDLANLATRLEPGHRLALVASYGWPEERAPSSAYTPQVTIEAAGGGSQLVLPVVEGTLGGAAPSMAYPPRPFGPDAYRE